MNAEATSRAEPARAVQLLLVDDDPSAIRVMSRMLAHYPDQRFATTGEEALRLARELTPDLILLDADMPGMSGFDVCTALKADPTLARVPVIFVTSHTTPALEAAALDMGAADFVMKPLVAAQLSARVRAQLHASRKRSERQKTEAFADAGSTQAPRLLIVDDDSTAIRILHHTLEAMGEFHFATSGAAGLKMARHIGPDLILLDAAMPDLDGFAVCEALKNEAELQNIPIIFVTRFSDPRVERRAFDLGASDFISKPYTPEVVQARVRSLLEVKRRNTAELRAAQAHWRGVSDARVADIVNSATDAIVSHDASGRVVLANAAAGRLFGTSADQLVGSTIQAWLGEEFDADAVASAERPHIGLPGRDGSRISVEVSVSRVGAGAERLTTVVLRDVSDRDRLEAESRARAEAEASSRMKTMMLSYVAHEIGNPLNGMLGLAELMACDSAQPLPPAQARRLDLMQECGERMRVLFRDLLDLGRFESGMLDIDVQQVDPVHSAEQAVAALAALSDAAGVRVSVAAPRHALRVAADADRLQQCLVNLITNAVKYNRRGGWVRVEIGQVAEHLEIAVRDNGLGLDPAQQQHLFEPFNRLGQKGRTSGAGLGLLITRQLVEAMNGRLRLESEPGKGSRFTIVLGCEPRAVTPLTTAEQAA